MQSSCDGCTGRRRLRIEADEARRIAFWMREFFEEDLLHEHIEITPSEKEAWIPTRSFSCCAQAANVPEIEELAHQERELVIAIMKVCRAIEKEPNAHRKKNIRDQVYQWLAGYYPEAAKKITSN